MRGGWGSAALTAIFLGVYCTGTEAVADGLTISPILIEADEGGGATSLTIASTSADSTILQVRVFEWQQVDGRDVLTPSNDVAFSPEIFELGSNQKQVVRMLSPARKRGTAWRVYINELPSPKSDLPASESGLDVHLEYVLPMFVGTLAEDSDIDVEISDSDTSPENMTIRNNSDQPVRLHTLSLNDAQGQEAHFFRPALVYVLPGQQRDVAIADPISAPTTLNYHIGQTRYEHVIE